MKKVKIISLILIISIIVLIVVLNLNKKEQKDDWTAIRKDDIAKTSDEWKEPVWLEVNTANWEDSAYISGDGNTLYFAYYPGDLIADLITWEFKDDIDVYVSQKPFTTKNKYQISENVWSEAGVMISDGDVYYMSNKDGSDDIYKNGLKLDLNKGDEDESDPHYCKQKDELYFWKKDRISGKGKIYVFKNNNVIKLPNPVNGSPENEDIQPFLTRDCQTIYFTSNREGIHKIYKSRRLEEDKWEKPEVVISSKNGVGEPTLTDDERLFFFVQLFVKDNGERNLDIIYTEKR